VLILTRKLGETLRIGDEIKIIVLDSKNGQVKLGIDAPSEIAVYRQEIYEKIQEENKSATGISARAVREVAKIFRGNAASVVFAMSLGLSGLVGCDVHAADISSRLQSPAAYEIASHTIHYDPGVYTATSHLEQELYQ